MDTNTTPGYFSIHQSTTDLLLDYGENISGWGNLKPNALKKTKTNTRSTTRSCVNNSIYNGILTVPNGNPILYCAVFESTCFSPTVGICTINPHTSSLKVIEISDSPTFVRTIHKLNVICDGCILEIILPCSYKKRKTNFVKILENNLPENVNICYVSDNLFKLNKTQIDTLCNSVELSERKSFKVELDHKKLGLAAACACISYISVSPSNSFVHDKFNVRYEASEDSMFISASAVDHLELIKSNSLNSKHNNMSLFKFLNLTVTKMGERLLKNNILQPLTNKNSLLLRYDAVNEMIENSEITMDIRILMKDLVDLDSLFSYLCKKHKTNLSETSHQKINFVLLLKKIITQTICIRKTIQNLESELVIEVYQAFNNPDIDSTLELINECINEDCEWATKPIDLQNQKCYAVKVGQNGILDASRQLYKSLIDEILQIIEKLSDQYSIPLEGKFDKNRGFYIFIKDYNVSFLKDFEDSPFIDITRKGNHVECNTLEIVKLNLRIESVLNEIFLMTEGTIEILICKCKKYISSYFLMSEAFALLDLICTFATKSTKSHLGVYSRPKFDEKNVIFKNCRHPLLEEIFALGKINKREIVSNDVTIIAETSRMQIITGVNMSGKSIYLRQAAINIILVQIGMLVPAEYVSTKIFKSLFTRISNDVTEPNMSTFSMEMTETSFILQNANKDSFIIIDELGRGTGYKDGISISIGVIEQIRKIEAICLFVTHFVGIPKIFQNKPGIFELYMSKEADTEFKIRNGINWESGYGIRMVEDTKLFPDDVIKEAKQISNEFRITRGKALHSNRINNKRNIQNKLILNCHELLQHIVYNVSTGELFETAAALEDEFVNKYDPLETEEEEEEEEEEDKVQDAAIASSSSVVDMNYSYTDNSSEFLVNFSYRK